jgi:hypothetical protein
LRYKRLADDQVEHGVAEELHALVALEPVVGDRGVGERFGEQVTADKCVGQDFFRAFAQINRRMGSGSRATLSQSRTSGRRATSADTRRNSAREGTSKIAGERNGGNAVFEDRLRAGRAFGPVWSRQTISENRAPRGAPNPIRDGHRASSANESMSLWLIRVAGRARHVCRARGCTIGNTRTEAENGPLQFREPTPRRAGLSNGFLPMLACLR